MAGAEAEEHRRQAAQQSLEQSARQARQADRDAALDEATRSSWAAHRQATEETLRRLGRACRAAWR